MLIFINCPLCLKLWGCVDKKNYITERSHDHVDPVTFCTRLVSVLVWFSMFTSTCRMNILKAPPCVEEWLATVGSGHLVEDQLLQLVEL